MLYNKKLIIHLFNEGILTVESADWYARNGYGLIVNDGILTDIIQEVV